MEKKKTLKAFYKDFKHKFSKQTIDALIKAFNDEVGNNGWTGMRGAYLAALQEEFIDRNFDCNDFINIKEKSMSLCYKIYLDGNKLRIIC